MLLDAAPADGTTPGVQGVTITNGGTTTYNWQLGREPSRVTVVPDAGSLAPGASVSITVYFWDQGIAPRATAGTYSTVSHVYDTAGVYPPISLPVSVAETNVSQQWYVAEGYTGGSFTEHLTLAHPGSANTNVTVEYLLANGTPITRAYGVAGRSRATINVNKAIGAGQNVSVVVTSDQPIVAERPMYFSYGGGQAGGTDIVGYQLSAPLASLAVAWNVQASASPSPVSPYASQYANYLYGVAGASSNDMRAVGQYLTSNNWASLIEHWDGTL